MDKGSGPGMLPNRPFGKTGVQVHPICIGCAHLGNMPEAFGYPVSEEQALTTIRAILDGPINFFDTAASYADGESERRIGVVLRERGGLPQGFVLSTKADRDLHTGEFTGDQMRRSVERSLRLLGLDSFQVLYLHDPEHVTWDEIMAPGGPLEVLVEYRDQGVIQHLGVGGGPIDLMIRYVETGLFEAVITHNRYTLLNTEAAPLLEVASARGLAVVNAAPYGSGILAKGPDAYPRYAYRDAEAELVDRARLLQSACDRYGIPLAAAALQFSLRDSRLTATIVGMTRPERIAQTVKLATMPIPEGLWTELEALLPPPGQG